MTLVTSSTTDKTDKSVYPPFSLSYFISVHNTSSSTRDRWKKAARDASVFGSLSKDDGGIGRSDRLDAASRETRGTPRDGEASYRVVSVHAFSPSRIRSRFSVMSWRTVLYCIRGRVLWTTAVIVYVGVAERERERDESALVSSRRARRIKAGISADEHRS